MEFEKPLLLLSKQGVLVHFECRSGFGLPKHELFEVQGRLCWKVAGGSQLKGTNIRRMQVKADI